MNKVITTGKNHRQMPGTSRVPEWYYTQMPRPRHTGLSNALRGRIAAALLLAFLPFFSAAVAVEGVFFTPQAWRDALHEQDLPGRYPRLLLAATSGSADLLIPGAGSWLSTFILDQGGESFIRTVAPPAYIDAETERLLQEILDYANFQDRKLDLAFDLRPVKTRLTGGLLRDLKEAELTLLPPCAVADARDAIAALLDQQLSHLPRCRPPDLLLGLYLDAWQGALSSLSLPMPDQIRLLPARTEAPTGAYPAMRWFLRLSPLAVLLLVVAGIWHTTSPRTFFRWLQAPLLGGGLLSLALSSGVWFFLAWLLPLPIQILPVSPALVYEFIASCVLAVTRQTLFVSGTIGAVLTLGGLTIALTLPRLKA